MKSRAHLSEPAVRTTLMDDVFGPVCELCGKRGKDVDIISWSVDGDPFLMRPSTVEFYKYHMACVRNILNDPGKHKESRVDFSIGIVKRLSVRKSRQRAHDLFTLKSKIKTIKEREWLNKEANRARHRLREL